MLPDVLTVVSIFKHKECLFFVSQKAGQVKQK